MNHYLSLLGRMLYFTTAAGDYAGTVVRVTATSIQIGTCDTREFELEDIEAVYTCPLEEEFGKATHLG